MTKTYSDPLRLRGGGHRSIPCYVFGVGDLSVTERVLFAPAMGIKALSRLL